MAIKYFRKNIKTHSFAALTTLMVVHPMTANAFTYEKILIQDNAVLPISVETVLYEDGLIIISPEDAYDSGVSREDFDYNSPEHVRAYSWEGVEPGDVIATARKLIGEPYVFAASHPRSGFDCSGFVKFVYGATHKIYLPHSATQQTLLGEEISLEEAQPGDLVAYGSGSNYSHIGIYSGDGKLIHSARSQGGVLETSVDRVAGPKKYIRVTIQPAD